MRDGEEDASGDDPLRRAWDRGKASKSTSTMWVYDVEGCYDSGVGRGVLPLSDE